MWRVRDIADKITNVVMNYTEIEAKVRAATNDEAWGPTGALMQEIAHATFTFEHFPEVMTMLWKRMLQDNKSNWRRTYKALLLLNYLVRNGSERVVTSSREHIYDLRGLENYSFIDEFGKDQGINVRHKVKELIEFVQDDEKLREERKKAKKNKDKFIGLSNEGISGSRNFGDDKRYSTPKWIPDENNWNSEKGKETTLGFHETSYDSDENENKYDSDGEIEIGKIPPITLPNNNVNNSSPVLSSISNTPTRNKNPIKKIDLGAAANYGKEVSIEKSVSPQIQNSDLLCDIDFDTLSSNDKSKNTSQLSNIQDFGDFTTAFSNNSQENKINNNRTEDEFADFSSAFSNSASISSVENTVDKISNNSLSNADLLSDITSNDSPVLLDAHSPFGNMSSIVIINLAVLRNSRKTQEKWNHFKKILNEENEDNVENILIEILESRPGPLTPQMVCQIDCDTYITDKNFFVRHYVEILDEFALKINHRKLIPLLKELYVLDGGNGSLLYESLNNLKDSLKVNMVTSSSRENIIFILVSLFNSEFIASSMVHECMKTSCNSIYWQDLIRLLVSYPSRLANILKTDLPEFFSSVNYTRVLFINIFKAMKVIIEACNYCDIYTVNVEPISYFLSKIILNFDCMQEFERVVSIFESSCVKDVSFHSLVSNILLNLELSAVNHAAYAIFHRQSSLISHLLGNDFVLSPKWKNCICDTMFFKTYYEDDNILRNLINYLKSYPDLLFEILENLLEVWSDKTSINQTCFEQHLYLSKAIILSSEILSSNTKLVDNIDKIESILFLGVPAHLESPNEKIRVVGMVVAEFVLSKGKPDVENKLKFDYEGLNSNLKLLVQQLKSLNTFSSNVEESNADSLNEYIKNVKSSDICSDDIKIKNEYKNEINTMLNECKIPVNHANDEWDSDDELEPYDLSNDVKTSTLQKPSYLRDLIENLLERNNADVWINSIECCEELIKNQLINDDPCTDVLVGSAQDLSTLKREKDEKIKDTERKKEETEWKRIIQERIERNTKYKLRPTQLVTKINNFNSCVGYFFYPLIRGNNKFVGRSPQYMLLNVVGVDWYSLLAHYVDTLAIIMCSAVNCLPALKMGEELLEFTKCLRFHIDATVRNSILRCTAAILISIPRTAFNESWWINEIDEIRSWLENCIHSRNKFYEPNTECRELASQAIALVKILPLGQFSPSVTPVQPSSSSLVGQNHTTMCIDKTRNNKIGSTWSNLTGVNINIDDLGLSSSKKSSSSTAPSMNQLATGKSIDASTMMMNRQNQFGSALRQTYVPMYKGVDEFII
ncbi:hypothetical protein PGB90_008052 [Kerria lacca]